MVKKEVVFLFYNQIHNMKNCTAACSSCSNENKYCLDELTWKWASVDPRQVKTVISILSISPTFTSHWLVGQESADGESFVFCSRKTDLLTVIQHFPPPQTPR